MRQRKIHFEILQAESEPKKRFLQKTMSGVLWTSRYYVHKFLDLGEAVGEQRKHENSYIIWVDESKDAREFYGSWGEVNRDYIARTF